MVTSTGLENQEKLYRLNKLWFFFRAQSLFQMAWNEFIEGEIDAVKTQLTYCLDSIWLNARGIYLKARVMGNAFYSARALFKRSIFHPVYIGPIFGDKYLTFAESNATFTWTSEKPKVVSPTSIVVNNMYKQIYENTRPRLTRRRRHLFTTFSTDSSCYGTSLDKVTRVMIMNYQTFKKWLWKFIVVSFFPG